KKFEKKEKSEISKFKKLEYTSVITPGEKKDTTCALPDKYYPKFVEAAWYDWWQAEGFFTPEYNKSLNEINNIPSDDKFITIIPPPNVTGTLHIGHALMCAIQDALARWNRMRGKVVLWNPGSDHAGIATQVVVEKKLKREQNMSRHDLGRENFLKEVWKWKEEKGDIMSNQMRRIGISVDWNRNFFTMDQTRSASVTEAFVRLHSSGLVYRSKRLVNWSCALKSAISDIEVDKMEINGRQYLNVPGYTDKVEFGVLSEFSYQIEGSNEYITVATTRLETMLGDVAIAVHPQDLRYDKYIGKFAIHPFCDRKLSIIADDEGNITNELDLYEKYRFLLGSKRFHARKLIYEALQEKNLFVRKYEHSYVIPICSRTKDIIEPIIKLQWYVNCNEMSKRAIEAIKSEQIKIHPSFHEKTLFHWLQNIQDWCISRTEDDNFWVCGTSLDQCFLIAENRFNIPRSEMILTQDEDVLDT
ncbi:hypothetical protein MXB_1760, partial [Myxobolus squamalis]